MFYALDQTSRINRFVDVVIPSARDLYARLGFRNGSGIYTTDGLTVDDIPVLASGQTVIDQVIHGQELLELEAQRAASEQAQRAASEPKGE